MDEFNTVPASEWTRLWADYKALREAASDYIEGKHFPDCKALRVDLKNPRCTCGHDALAALLDESS